MPVYVSAILKIFPTQRDAMIALMKSTVPSVRAEKGCLRYDAHANAESVFFYEVWADQAALDAHMATPHMKAFFAAAASMMDGPDDMRTWQPVDVLA